MKRLYHYLTHAYHTQPLIYTKKATYAALLNLFVICIILFTLPLALRDLRYAPIPVVALFTILLLCLVSLTLVRRGHLEQAVNILLLLGILRIMMLFPEAYAILLYLTSAVVIVSTAICQIRAYQMVLVAVMVFSIHSAKLIEQTVRFHAGLIQLLELNMHIYGFLHILVMELIGFFVIHIIRSEIRKSEELVVSQTQLSNYAERLKGLNALLEDAASRDQITGAFNRRKMNELMNPGPNQGDGPTAYSMVMFDLDDFKQVNDTYGHQAGDEVLAGTARTVMAEIRISDALIRWGGEEFLLLLHSETPDGTRETSERLRKFIEQKRYHLPGAPKEGIFVTASFGYADPRPGETQDQQISRADACLYEAKRAGKNRVIG